METLRAAYEMAKMKRWGTGNRRGHLRGHRGARRGGSARAVRDELIAAHLPATSRADAGDTEGRVQSPRPLDSGKSATEWCKARSSSYSSLSSRRISNRDRFGYRPKRTAHDAVKASGRGDSPAEDAGHRR